MSIRSSGFSIQNNYDHQKLYLNEIHKKAEGNNFFQAVTNKVCDRYAESSSFIANVYSFRTQIQRYLKGQLLHFLMYKMLPQDFNFHYDYSHIFEVEKNSSLLDIFESLVNFVCYAKISEREDYNNYAKTIILELNRHLNHPSIQGIANSYGVETKWDFRADEYALLDMYTHGDYQKLQSDVLKNIESYIKFSLFEILAKSCARNKSEVFSGLKQTILKKLINVFLKNEDYIESVSYLFSMCHCFSSLSWFKELYFLLIKETNFLSEHSYKNFSVLSSSFSDLNSPLKANSLPDGLKEKFIKSCEDSINNSVSIELFKTEKIVKNYLVKKIEGNRFKKYYSIGLIKNDEVDKAITILKELSESVDVITAFEATRLLSNLYIRQKMNREAIDLFVEKSIENKNVILNFDTTKICLIAKEILTDSKSISIPIALSLHSRYVNSDYDSALKYSFEKFLNNNEVENPIDLLHQKEIFQENQLNYFLEYVCTPEVMKLYLYFDSTIDIQICRIEICKYLIENCIPKEQLIDEVKENTKLLVIRDAVKQVDNSRIYADTNIAQTVRAEGLKQLFKKFKTLRLNDYESYEDEATLKKLYLILEKSEQTKHQHHIVFLPNTPLNEKNSTFLNLIRGIRDDFAYGNNGLNSHLSTRIRHGHFPTMLRKCLTDESLVTAKLAKSNSYKSNSLWLNKLDHLKDDQLTKIDKLLNLLSANFEELICEINDSWLQIWTLDQDISSLAGSGNKTDALFSYSVSELEAYAIQQKIFENSDFSDFLKILTQWFWDRTEENLKTIREKLSTEVRKKAYKVIDDFQKDVIDIVEDQQKISELSDSLSRARTALSSNLEQIVSWFSRSEGSIVEKFEFDTAVEIAKKAANANACYSEDLKMNFLGNSLSPFVDILYILFENAISKSNIPKERLFINTKLLKDDSGNGLVLSVENNCLEVSSVEKANLRLDFYRNSFGKDKVINSNDIQGEGGTGFFKIWNILSKNIEIMHEFELGYINNEAFMVKLTMLNIESIVSR